ncbi:tRNA adenosine deaminase-associated protein [Corynebacterium tapiri]
MTSDDGQWQVRRFADDFTDPTRALKAVRALRSPGAAFALLCVEDEYFVILRPAPSRNLVLLSDVTMAVDDDYARDLAEDAGMEIPDIDPDTLDDIDGWPEGDFEVLEDLGLSEEILGVIADDQDLYPHQAIMRIADELGFSEELSDATDYS